MYKYKRNGFTLVELMAVIIIISLIAILTFPNIVNQIKKTKKSNNKMVEDLVLTQAKKYVSDNPSEFEDNEYCIGIDALLNNDYIKDGIVKNSDIMSRIDKKVIFLSNDNYKLVDKDKCKVEHFEIYKDTQGNKFTKVEYLESTGTQYIDTGIYPKSTTKIDVEFSLPDYPQSNSWWVNGWGSSAYQESFEWGVGKSKWMFSVSSNSKEIFLDIPIDLEKHNIHLESGSQKFDNVEYATNTIGNTATDKQMIYLFALNAEWVNGTTSYMPEKIYSVKIYDGDQIVRDYIPVINNNKTSCLYDRIEKKCYYNQGTGEFLYG